MTAKPTAPRRADPNPREIKASELAPGMRTFIRVMDGADNVKFKEDCRIVSYVGECRPSGMHFITGDGKGKGKVVCYWQDARVWVKDS